MQGIAISLFLVALIIYFTISSDRFFTYDNMITILTAVSVLGIVTVGQCLTIISGGFDLSVGGVVPLGAVVFAKVVNGGTPVGVAILLAVILGGVIGLINGLVISRLKINPLIATLAMLSIAGGIAYSVVGGQNIAIENPSASILSDAWVADVPNQVWILAIITVAAWLVLNRTVVGRAIFAVGGNREASWLAGMRVDLITTCVYVACGALAAFAGTIMASELLSADGGLGSDSALTSISAVILGGASLSGGVGSVLGAIVGILILGVLNNGLVLLNVSAFYQDIITGVVLLLAVGLVSLRGRLLSR